MTKTNPISLTANPDGTHTLSLFDRDIGWLAPVQLCPHPRGGWRGVTVRGDIVRAATLLDCRQLLLEAAR